MRALTRWSAPPIVTFSGDPARVATTSEEIAYLCDAASSYFARPIVPADVVWSFSGVRPLHGDHVGDPEATTRDYVLELDAPPGHAALLSVFGGKITTYRRLAEAASNRLAPSSAAERAATRRLDPCGAALPGGDFPIDGLAALYRRTRGRIARSSRRPMRNGLRRPMAQGRGPFSTAPAPSPISASRSVRH